MVSCTGTWVWRWYDVNVTVKRSKVSGQHEARDFVWVIVRWRTALKDGLAVRVTVLDILARNQYH